MIEARHHPAFASAFSLYTSLLFRRRFHAVWVRGSLPDTRAPLVVAAQHVGWWDPMLLFFLSRSRFSGTHFVMMEEPNLRKYGFFRWLGAFGVDRERRASVVASLRYALARLQEPHARVWVFPQGRIMPSDARPLACGPGAAWLAARARAPLVAVAIRYDFLETERPQAFVSFSPPRMVDSDRSSMVEEMLTAEADALRNAVATRELEGFDRVLRSSRRQIRSR